jgi:hypothetical protein
VQVADGHLTLTVSATYEAGNPANELLVSTIGSGSDPD